MDSNIAIVLLTGALVLLTGVMVLVTFLYLKATQNLLKITGFGAAATNLIAMKRAFADSTVATREVLESWSGFRLLRGELSAPTLLVAAAAYWHMDAAFMASRTAGVEQPWLEGVQREIELWLGLPIMGAVYESHIKWTLAHSNGFLEQLAITFNDSDLLEACRASDPTSAINSLRDQRLKTLQIPQSSTANVRSS